MSFSAAPNRSEREERTLSTGRKADVPVVCFVTGSAGDWGGASRVLFTNLRGLDRQVIHPLLLLPRSGPIESELQTYGLDYVIWGSLTEPGNVGSYCKAFFRSLVFFVRNRVSLVHLNHRAWRPAEVLAARALRIPVVIHYHLINERTTPCDRLSRAGIAVSEYTARMSAPASLEKHVVYNPVDMARFAEGRVLRDSLGLTPETVVVSFLGQIRDIKGVQDFIAMARTIELEQAVFLIAGECRDPEQFPGSYTKDELISMIGGDKRIRYLGYVDRVEDLYCTSDVVVVPSRWEEPLGLIAIEAGACGKPVVGTRVGGIPEVIDDGVSGFLCDAGDVPGMAERVTRLITDPVLRARLGTSALSGVRARFAQQPVRQFEALLHRFATE